MNKRPSSSPMADTDFPAFTLRRVSTFHVNCIEWVDLLLPLDESVDQLVEQRGIVARELYAKHEEENAAARQAEDTLREEHSAKRSWVNMSRGHVLPSADAERAELQLVHEQQLKEPMPGQVQIYEWDEPCKLLEQVSASADRKLRERDQALFAELKKRRAFRQFGGQATANQALEALRGLRNIQPHFGEVVDLIEGRLLMAAETGKPTLIPPILLAGEPGVGKTHFTLELARALGRRIIRHGFDLGHTGEALLGSARHWSNTEPGLVFNAVCMGEQADPVVLLDEIDKACARSSNNPLAPLHSLLEPLTAKAVKDISVGITFDASHVFWLATANDLQNIPEPILSRFRVFHIHSPTAEQAIEMARAVAASVHERFPSFEPPEGRLVTLLAHLTPREQIQALEDAFARARVNGRKQLLRQDLPAHVAKDHASDETSNGFLH